jgi:capsule polysaccharide export protein KpsE/RkpR
MSHHRPRGLAAAVLLGLVASLAACGSSSSSSSTSEASPSIAATTAATSGDSTPGTASAEVCAARDDLQTSITDLKDVNIVAGGTSSLQAAITKVKDNLATLKSAAGDELQPQVTAAQDALTALQSALKDVSSGGVSAVVTAAAKVASTGGVLLTDLQGLKCS